MKKYAQIIFSAIVLALIIAGGRKFAEKLDISALADLLGNLSALRVISYAVAGMIPIWLTFLYDLTVHKYMNVHLRLIRTMKIAVIARSINIIAGFGGVGGATARVLLYKNSGVPEKAARKISLYIMPSTITGFGFLMLLNLLGITGIEEFIASYRWTYFLMVGFILYVPVFCWFTDIKGSVFNTDISQRAKNKGTKMRIKLSLVSSVDLIAAGVVFAFIMSGITDEISIGQSIGIFSMAAATGIVSMIPAGVGSFDLMLVNGLLIYGAASHEAVAALLLFRFFYYALPALVGAILSAGELSGAIFKRKR